MSNNMIGPDGAKAIATVLQKTKYITELWLNCNGIFPDGAAALG